MRSRYRKTFAGLLWVVLNPVILYSVQSLVFQNILKIDISDYPLFLLTGLLPWTFFTQSLEMGIPVIDSSRELLKGIKTSPFNLVMAQVTDNIFNFLLVFIILLIPYVIIWGSFDLKMLLAPVTLVPLIVSVSALVALLSMLNIFYRDIKYIAAFVVNVMFFLTPIFYPRSFVPESFRLIVDLNPIYIAIAPFRSCFLPYSDGPLWLEVFKSYVLAIVLVWLTIYIWKKNRNEFNMRL